MPVPDLDLRLVRYFVAVAEYGNVGRAAGALHVAQPSLSRQIDRLEALVGVRLLERTPRGTRLTDSGEVFLRQARELLRCAERAVTQARARAGIRRITIGHSGNLIITPAVTELRKRHPEAGISTRAVEWDEPRAALLEHRNDIVLARLPFPSAELDIEVLYEEERGLVVPACHCLAGRKSLVLNDFRDEPLVRFADPELDAWWTIDPRPDGTPA
ncbi:LysR family transcriptional regulator, partial [Amycolatopsis acidicola]